MKLPQSTLETLVTNFSASLQQALEGCKRNNFTDNWDYRRFGPESPVGTKQRLKTTVKSMLMTLGIYRKDRVGKIKANEANLEWLYDKLADEQSREIPVKVLAFRMLGHRKVKLPLNTPAFWSKLDELEQQAEGTEKIPLGFLGWSLSKLDLHAEGYPIQLFIRPSGVFTQLLLQQYRCQTQDRIIEVERGDTVIDAGGCYGDTALYFAHKAGSDGKVFSFEFMPDNIEVFKRNLQLNPELASRIQIVENPLWSSSRQKLFIEGTSPAAHVTPHPKDLTARQIETLCIDDLVNAKGLNKVDFIKMDIEGAELAALNGAQATIRRHRPKLAIAVYHKLVDFWEIPQWIDQLGLGYRFHLRHFTIHAEETMLFAGTDERH
jgi:FkbM family methyltransferase